MTSPSWSRRSAERPRLNHPAATPTTPNRAATPSRPKRYVATRVRRCRSLPCCAAAKATEPRRRVRWQLPRPAPRRSDPVSAEISAPITAPPRSAATTAATSRDRATWRARSGRRAARSPRPPRPAPDRTAGWRPARPRPPGRRRPRAAWPAPTGRNAAALGDVRLRLEDDVDDHGADHQRSDQTATYASWMACTQVPGGPPGPPVLDQPLQLTRGGRDAAAGLGRLLVGEVVSARFETAHPRAAPSWITRVATVSTSSGSWLAKTIARPFCALVLQPLRQPGHTLGVQPLLRFVHDQQLAGADERRGQREPTTLTGRQGARQLTRLRDELDLLEHLVDHLVRIGRCRGPGPAGRGAPPRSGRGRSQDRRSRWRRRAGSPARSRPCGLPQTSTVPSSGRSAPTRQRSRVDLPAPLRPVSAMASPARTSRLNLSMMVLGPKARLSPETLRTVGRLAMEAILPLPGNRSRRISLPLSGHELGHDMSVFTRQTSRVTNPARRRRRIHQERQALSSHATVKEAPMTTMLQYQQRVAAGFLSQRQRS